MASTPLHNIFLRNLHIPQANIASVVPDYRSQLAAIRHALIESQRFSLDVKAVWEIVDRADLDVKHLMDRVQLAHLPFDKIWLEYSQRDKVEANYYAGRGPRPAEDTPDMAGFLITRSDNRADCWKATRVAAFGEHQDVANKKLQNFMHGISLTEYVFDASSAYPIVRQDGLTTLLKDDTYGFSETDIAIALWGAAALQRENDPLDEARKKASLVLHPFWRARFQAVGRNNRNAVTQNQEALRIELEEMRGELRFLVTALAVINEVPVIISDEVRPPKPTFLAGGRMQPYLSHRTVTINVPAIARKQKTVSEILYEAGSKRRRHKVRRHERIYLNKDGSVRKKIWVEEHERGDAELGYVMHDYVVTSKGRRTR